MLKPKIVIGPPGTGKTTCLLSMVEAALEKGVAPDRIGYFSFTRRAADEAITRACEKFGKDRKDFPYFRTLHSLCFMYLGLSSADVLEGKRLQEFADYAGIRITGRWSEDGTMSGFDMGDRILFMENLARVRRVPLRQQYDENDDQLPWSEVDRVARALAEFKDRRGLMDYTDMLLEFVRTGSRPKLEELFVDEVQDQSTAQWDVARLLAQGTRQWTVAGDDDQAIYRWAGADVDQFLSVEGDVEVLGQSWRVPMAIQRVAQVPISAVRKRRPKAWSPRAEEGEVEYESMFENVDTSGKDILILARNDYVLREQVEPVLRTEGVIYEKRGHPSVKASIMEAVTLWEQLRKGETISGEEARKVYVYLSSGTGVARGHKTLPGVGDDQPVDMRFLKAKGGLLCDNIWHEALDRLPPQEVRYIVAARRQGERLRQKPRVRVSTIHGSKGGEADHVVLLTEMAARTHAEMQVNPEDEARCWYVGATRAREKLTIVKARTSRACPWL